MNERPVVFGAHGGLVGILSEPLNGATARTAVIVSNIGMHHRVGPFRLYVELARRLAKRDIAVLRFDLAGMGDSEPRHDAATPAERARRDLDDAMQMLSTSVGAERFILIGLCSGVDSTHATAAKDPRVIAAAFIDGYSYPSVGYRVRRFTVGLMHLDRWKGFIRRHLYSGAPAPASDSVPDVFQRENPTREEFRRDVVGMARRGLRLLFIYSGGVYYRFNSPRQFFETIGAQARGRGIEVEAMYSADHVFTSIEKRDMLITRLERWVQSVLD